MEVISTNKAPAAIGPYSQAIIYNGLIYTSGQIPINPNNGCIEGTCIEEQAKQIFDNIREILLEANTDFSKVIKTTCFLANMKDFNQFNKLYSEYFISSPARSCVEVSSLPKGVLAEVEVIAVVN